MFGFLSKQLFSGRHGFRRVLLAGAVVFLAVLASLAVTWPEVSGEKVVKKGKLTVDAGHASEGYFAAMGKKGKRRLKLRVTKGKTVYTYDINNEGEYEIFPLQLGSGSYSIALYENAGGKKYTEAGKVKITCELEDEEAAFLIPNKFVHYTADSEAVKMSETLCAGLSTETEKYKAICAFMRDNFIYDFIKAATVQAGALPAIDETLKLGRGICQDLAGLMVCMLRVQGIHAREVVGYADTSYHAWVTANVDGEEQFFDPTVEVKGLFGISSYTQEIVY